MAAAAAPATPAPATPAASPEAPPPPRAAAVGLASKILKQGKPPPHLPSTEKVLGRPGNYRVDHGSVTLGYDLVTGERTVAWAGAHITLSAEEAGPLLAAGTVTRLEDQ